MRPLPNGGAMTALTRVRVAEGGLMAEVWKLGWEGGREGGRERA
jgi:hypothetical protein